MEKEKLSENKQTIIIFIMIIIIIGSVLGFVLLSQKDKTNGNNQQEQDNNYQLIKIGDKVKYELREYYDDSNSQPIKRLYVNNKLIDEKVIGSIDKLWEVFELDDILVVLIEKESEPLYYLNSKGEKIGTFKGSLDNTDFVEIIDKDVYISTYVDGASEENSSVCDYDDDKIVQKIEKMTYLGDNQFSSNIVVSEQTKLEFIEEKGIGCSDELSKVFGSNYKELKEDNQEITVNGNNIKIKDGEDGLYINDKLVDTEKATGVIIQNKYAIMISGYCQCGFCITKFIDEDGSVKDVKNTLNDSYRQFVNLNIENGTIIASAEDCPCMDENCEKPYKVNFIYQNKELSIVKAK